MRIEAARHILDSIEGYRNCPLANDDTIRANYLADVLRDALKGDDPKDGRKWLCMYDRMPINYILTISPELEIVKAKLLARNQTVLNSLIESLEQEHLLRDWRTDPTTGELVDCSPPEHLERIAMIEKRFLEIVQQGPECGSETIDTDIVAMKFWRSQVVWLNLKTDCKPYVAWLVEFD